MFDDPGNMLPIHKMLESHERLSWLMRAVFAKDTLPVAPNDVTAARRSVEELNNLAGEPLAVWIDGRSERGIRLTQRGRRLCVGFIALREEQARLLSHFGDDFAEDLLLLDRVAVRTSARNQFLARVQSISRDGLMGEVILELAGGHRIRAGITDNSATALRLREGREVVALIKASAVDVAGDDHGDAGCNRLRGTISYVLRHAETAEITVDLGSGLTAVSLVKGIPPVDLVAKSPVTIAFHPSRVLIGIVD